MKKRFRTDGESGIVHGPPAASTFHRRDRCTEGADGRGRMEYTRSCSGFARLYNRQPLAEPRKSFQGREAIEAFLTRKWSKELDYRLIKETGPFATTALRCALPTNWRDDSGNWFRSYGNENWEFDEHGLMRLRIASINDLPIKENERKYHWPLGRRPDDHPSLSELGL